MKTVVVLSGAGISAESGLTAFRGDFMAAFGKAAKPARPKAGTLTLTEVLIDNRFL